MFGQDTLERVHRTPVRNVLDKNTFFVNFLEQKRASFQLFHVSAKVAVKDVASGPTKHGSHFLIEMIVNKDDGDGSHLCFLRSSLKPRTKPEQTIVYVTSVRVITEALIKI